MKRSLLIIKKTHLWLGLLTGPLVFVIALTGAIYSFQEEIQNAIQPYRFYNKTNDKLLSPTALKQIAATVNPKKKVHAVMLYSDNHSSKVIFYEYEKYYDIVYLNPENGQVLSNQNAERGFFPFILDGHFYLWLPPEIGQPLVASVTLVFLLIVIFGLISWWPKSGNKAQRFKIKWKASWKRLNFDLHSVFGFYTLLFSFVFAITGLVWGFIWFKNTYFKLMSGGSQFIEYYEPMSLEKADSLTQNIDKTFYFIKNKNPQYHYIEVHFPETQKGSLAVNVNTDEGTYWKTNYYYFDQKTLKDIAVDHYWGKLQTSSFAEKLMRMNYDIHTGAILGIPGKILVFFMSLIIASLPITGFIFYLGKLKKKK